ncbi:MAG: SMP-30/gluconolactonase/LRE family protein [Legionellales bacterium]|nr:SMP-30/gluconolactonase/LRE family protein [Legionellales bacterium]
MQKNNRDSLIRCVYEAPCILGEGPVWHPQENRLYWVDIVAKTLHSLDPKNNHHHAWKMPADICCVAPNKQGGLIAALKQGIALLNPVSNHIHYLAELPKELSDVCMFNDGHCDYQGRFWIGCKDLSESKSIAPIFQFTARQQLIQQQTDCFIVANALVTSLDSRYFYIADSPKRVIYRYDFDPDAGKIYNPRVFVKVPEEAGYPDGMTIDSQGYLWGCHFNGWRVTRYDPDGQVDRVIPMPISAPTSCCLGGPDLKKLFITSAKRDVTESELKHQPLAGCVFAIDVDVPGVHEPFFNFEALSKKD